MSALPLPPKEFSALDLRIEEADPSALLRIAWTTTSTHFIFRRNARYRFDAPDRSFGVLYAAFDLPTAFVETVLRELPQQTRATSRIPLAWNEIANRRVVPLRAGVKRRRLRLIALYGDGLVAARTDNRIATLDDYAVTREWAKACHKHPVQADGILYMSRFLGDRQSAVLFDRARAAVRPARAVWLLKHPDFPAMLDEFKLAAERPLASRSIQ
jgi:hypothetical protein